MKYRTLSAVLEAVSDGRAMRREDIAARVLRCKVWISGSGQPGCLYDSGPDYHASRENAVASAVWLADSGDADVRGMRAALIRDGNFTGPDGIRYEVSQGTVADMF